MIHVGYSPANVDQVYFPQEIIQRFGLGEASANNVRHTLSGPGPGGAPFLAQFTVDADKWEQLLVNSLGPVQLWTLSTTPGDSALRNRLYGRLGFSEALRRLSRVFPFGSAEKEIGQRKDDRLKRGERRRALQSVCSTSLPTS